MTARVELRRAPLDSYRVAPGQMLRRWVYSYRIDGGEWSLWDRGLPSVREQAARLGGVPVCQVIQTWDRAAQAVTR